MSAMDRRLVANPGRTRILDRLDRTIAELSAAQRPLSNDPKQQVCGR